MLHRQKLDNSNVHGIERLRTSKLEHLVHLPVEQTSLEDLVWVQETIRERQLSAAEREWLEFTATLMRWRRRFDILVGDPTRKDKEFDIAIEG